jgi:chitinase
MDVDWEYPVGPDWGSEIKARPEDRQNYIILLQEIRDALDVLGAKNGKRYGLSTAVPAGPWFLKVNDVRAAANIVDSLKLMTYDFYGGWSKNTGHHTNLYNNPNDPDWGGWSTDQTVKAYLTIVPPEKIMLGLGFYGHAFQGVKPGAKKNGLFLSYASLPDKPPFDVGGTISWVDIKPLLQPGSGYTRFWDNVAKAPYLYNGDIWISYTDEEQIKLIAKYAKQKRLGGVFAWEYGHDMGGELFKVLAESYQ